MEELYSLAESHRMVGILLLRLMEVCGERDEQLPSPWAERWRALFERDRQQLLDLKRILSHAGSCRLQLLLLKGFSVPLQVHGLPVPSQGPPRGASDIDLLVHPEHLLPMVFCLEDLGFRFRGTNSWSEPVSNWETFIREDSEAQFCHKESGTWVDLHWRLCAPRLEQACDLKLSGRLWKKTRTVRMGRIAAVIPGREEELLMLCLHMTKGGRFLLRNLCDLVQMIGVSPPLRWERLLRLAQETGTEHCAFYALDLVERVAPGAVPGFIRSRLARSAGPQWLLRPSLRSERLLRTQGEAWNDLAYLWNGILFARHPWQWFPYQFRRITRWLSRRGRAVLR